MLNFFKQLFSNKHPIIKEKTFFVWEPCSKSHSEVVPGYAKHLIDLGYHVSVLLTPERYKEGVFSRFEDENIFKNISFNKLNQKQIRKYFQNSSLDNVEGLMVTTAGKLCDEIHFDDCYKSFKDNVDKSKILFVCHEAKEAVDNNQNLNDIITLRKLNYKNASSTVVNPNYFGKIQITPKNKEITNFITIGAIQGKRNNNDLVINAAKKLINLGIKNFKITVIGKGHLKHLPKDIQKYFDIKGRLPFDKMYDEIEKADFLLTSYTKNNPKHFRYITTGTSGSFQLVYGFLKPCIILKDFATINGFNENNSIFYENDEDYFEALKKAILMSEDDYINLQNNLKEYVRDLNEISKQNLLNLINSKKQAKYE